MMWIDMNFKMFHITSRRFNLTLIWCDLTLMWIELFVMLNQNINVKNIVLLLIIIIVNSNVHVLEFIMIIWLHNTHLRFYYTINYYLFLCIFLNLFLSTSFLSCVIIVIWSLFFIMMMTRLTWSVEICMINVNSKN